MCMWERGQVLGSGSASRSESGLAFCQMFRGVINVCSPGSSLGISAKSVLSLVQRLEQKQLGLGYVWVEPNVLNHNQNRG